MLYALAFLIGVVIGAISIIALAFLWPDDDDDDYWDYSTVGRYYSGGRYGQLYHSCK